MLRQLLFHSRLFTGERCGVHPILLTEKNMSRKLSPGNVAMTRKGGEREGKHAGEAEDGSSKVCQVKDSFHFIFKTHGPCQRKGYKPVLHTGITLFKGALCCAGLLFLPCFFAPEEVMSASSSNNQQ